MLEESHGPTPGFFVRWVQHSCNSYSLFIVLVAVPRDHGPRVLLRNRTVCHELFSFRSSCEPERASEHTVTETAADKRFAKHENADRSIGIVGKETDE